MTAASYTRAQFRADLKAAGVTRQQFARWLGIDIKSTYNWSNRAHPFPVHVRLLLAAWIEIRRRDMCDAVKRDVTPDMVRAGKLACADYDDAAGRLDEVLPGVFRAMFDAAGASYQPRQGTST